MTPVVLIPYRPDHGHRTRLWRFLLEHYWAHLPFHVVVGEHHDGPFNRSKAINSAATNRDWDIAIIADADTWVPVRNLNTAVELARETGRLTAAFDAVVELSRACTDGLLTGRLTMADSFGAERVRTRELETQSSMLVITRELWDRIGGFDERFVNWAGEDNAAWHACALHSGTPNRIGGNAYHLWHRPSPGKFKGPDYHRNLALWKRYQAASRIKDLP